LSAMTMVYSARPMMMVMVTPTAWRSAANEVSPLQRWVIR